MAEKSYWGRSPIDREKCRVGTAHIPKPNPDRKTRPDRINRQQINKRTAGIVPMSWLKCRNSQFADPIDS